ncbi:hypothetical protein Q1695_001126 [Nippostrongylus brasiliensis]|nr:hypothetical protein Q1695_001126 [Nippostrongylus brasiliensis]
MTESNRGSSSMMSTPQTSSLKDMDLVNWLEKKLSDAGPWSGRMTASMLSREMLEELETCFQAIDVQTKLKIISCIPHMNPRKVSMVHGALLALLDLASKDADDWVETIADMYREMPTSGVIIPVTTNKDSHFAKTLEDITKCFQTHLENGNLKLTPDGHNIVSNSVIKTSFGPPPEFQKSFILRKKPKSFNLMNDMMKQCSKLVDASRERNNGLWSASVPIKIRSTLRTGNNDLPMKGIPNQNPCKLNSGFTYEPKKFQRQLSKREGGAKLLDICELPQSLKKRRQIEMVEERKRKQEEKEIAKKKALEDKKEREEARKAAQLRQENLRKSVEKKPRLESASCAQSFESVEQDTTTSSSVSEEPSFDRHASSSSNDEHEEQQQRVTDPNPESRRQMETSHSAKEPLNRLPHRVAVHTTLPHQTHLHHQQHQPHQQHLQQQQQQQQQQQHPQHHFVAHIAQQPSFVQRPPGQAGAVWLATPIRDHRNAAQRAREAAIMNQCNEMLRDANSLDQNGRQLVIAFMTGNKYNPRPELGHVITMKLSETIEDGIADNQMCKMKMDYQTGEWKRLRKCRLLQPHEVTNDDQYMYASNEDYHGAAQQQPT